MTGAVISGNQESHDEELGDLKGDELSDLIVDKFLSKRLGVF